MKAMVFTQYGSPDVLQLQEIAKPTPKDNEVLIKVCATSVNAADWHLLRGDPYLVRLLYGLFKPKNTILGADIAGRIEAVGQNVQRFRVGDAVFGDNASRGFGGFAEYVCVQEDVLELKPTTLTFEQAAAVPMAAVTALQGLRNMGRIQAGQKVLIHGASGGVGTFAVQIAKALGAEVTAVCSTQKMEMVRSLGADHVIDYTREDFTQNGQKYDLIFAANGDRSIFEYKRALTPTGIYVMAGGAMRQMMESLFLGPWISMMGTQKMVGLQAKPNQKDLAFINDLIKAEKVVPVMDRSYPLAEVPDALRYVEKGHAKGKVVIAVGA
jgi:NADPH:quinone reductase-like Zn-dependent oxidoreductase